MSKRNKKQVTQPVEVENQVEMIDEFEEEDDEMIEKKSVPVRIGEAIGKVAASKPVKVIGKVLLIGGAIGAGVVAGYKLATSGESDEDYIDVPSTEVDDSADDTETEEN